METLLIFNNWQKVCKNNIGINYAFALLQVLNCFAEK